MATNNYSITFKSLRSNTSYSYVLEITGGSGAFIPLKGGAQPFTTEENDDEDQFCPIRTQSGHIRIVDDGKDANGNALAADWWKDLAPINDTERPVTLKANGVVYWQGFMQAQNFGGKLYDNPQEREFPVQCCLSVLAATQVSTSEDQLCNFAYLLRYIFNNVPSHSITNYYFQGGSHAQQWLLKRLDWHNFLRDNDENGVEPRYNLFDILEDVCQFWGWTCRQYRTSIYFTCADDTSETYFLSLTPTNLSTMAGGSTAGTTSDTYTSATISGDVFASIDNDDFKQRGPNKATVKADCNEQDSIVEFAPVSVEKQLDANGWTWHQSGDDLCGYFETNNRLTSFSTAILSGSADTRQVPIPVDEGGGYETRGSFRRRQIYSTAEQDKPSEVDVMVINNNTISDKFSIPAVSIQTEKAMAFKGGSLKLKGSVYFNHYLVDWDSQSANLAMSIGIGSSRANAKWFYLNDTPSPTSPISHGWSSSKTWFKVGVQAGSIKGPMLFSAIFISTTYPAIPCDDPSIDFYGKLFIDIYGFRDGGEDTGEFQVADLTVEFSRDSIDIPTSLNVTRAREMKVDRVTTKEYVAENQNQTHEEWNADCIFASDNNMEYGYGLLMNADGSFMATAPYAGGNEHPEQHLANRVANYWARSRRRLGGDFRAYVHTNGNSGPIFSNITPQYKLTINGTTCHPVAISRDWRDDVVRLSLLEMPT